MFGLLSLWFGIFAPFAIFGAVRSLRRIRGSGGQLSGAGSAMAGLVAGSIALLVVAGGVMYWIVAS